MSTQQVTFDPSQSYQSAVSGKPAFDPGGSYQPATPKAVSSGAVSGVGRAISNLASMPGQLYDALTKEPQTDEEKSVHANGVDTPQGHVPGALALPFWRLVGKPMADAEDKATQYEQSAASEQDPAIKKQLLDAAGAWRIGSKVPMVGPVAANLAERAAYGEQGPSQKGAGDSAGWGNKNADISGALAEGTTYAAAPSVAGKAVDIAQDAGPAVRATVRATNAALKEAPGAAGAAIGGYLGHATGIPEGTLSGVIIGRQLGHAMGKGLPDLKIPGEGFGLPNQVKGGPAVAPQFQPEVADPSLSSPARTVPGQVAPEVINPEQTGPIPGVDVRPSLHRIMPDRGLALPPAPEYPGANLPEAPAPEVTQAKGLAEGSKAAPEPAKALMDLPIHAVNQAVQELGASAPIPSLTARANQIAKLAVEGAGGKLPEPLKPNVPIKNQGGVITPTETPTTVGSRAGAARDTSIMGQIKAEHPDWSLSQQLQEAAKRANPKPSDIPADHTPVESSVLKSYKYDPETQEFESVTQNGAHYVHGDVSPDQAAAFEAADSKGKAWNELRKNSTLVAKVVNGKRIPVKPVISPEDQISQDEWDAGHELETQVEGTKR